MKSRFLLSHALAVMIFLPCANVAAQQMKYAALSEEHPMQIDTSAGEIRLVADLHPDAFSGWLKFTSNYHALVWRKGRAAGSSLLSAYVDDRKVLHALEALGAQPGNNLTLAAWDERKNPNRPEPDQRIEGSPVDMLVWWQGLEAPLPIDSLLHDPGGRGIDLRFGGNERFIPKWKSGCIVCLYSCPGSKIGNHAYSVRDYVEGATHFEVNKRVAPEHKTRAVVIFRVKKRRVPE